MKLVRTIAAIGSVCACAGALAQETADEPRTLQFEVSQTLGYDDNLLRLPDGTDPPASVGDRGTAFSRTRGGVAFDRTWSLQRLRAGASAEAIRYDTLSTFDHEAWAGDLRWDWAIGRPWFGAFELGAQRFLSSFNDVRPFSGARPVRNLIDRTVMRASAGVRFLSDWAAVAGVDRIERDNSDPLRSAADLTERGRDVALRWTPGTALEGELRGRRVEGDYANRAVFDVFGDPIPGLAADNAYRQDEIAARAAWETGGASRFDGAIGHVRRTYPNLTQRNFSAPIVRVQYTWRPTGQVSVPIAVAREVASVEQFTSTFADTRRITVTPTWQQTAKRGFSLLLERRLRAFEGDPGTLLGATPSPRRGDATNLAGLRMTQELARGWFVDAELRGETRDSSIDAYRYDARIAFATLRYER